MHRARPAAVTMAAVIGAGGVIGASGAASADDTTAAARAAAAREQALPHTAAEFSSGFLALPGALVCPQSLTPETCNRGEFSIALGLQNIYRFGSFAVGAGIMWAHSLRSDAALGDPSLQREHSRSYFLVEGLGRYYIPTRLKAWDFWVGVTVGLVVLNDSWSTLDDRTVYKGLGPQAATLGTEGFSVGLAGGAEWSFLPNWSFGPAIRYANWFLPDTRAMSPTLDVASLAGRLDVIDVAIRVTYRIAL